MSFFLDNIIYEEPEGAIHETTVIDDKAGSVGGGSGVSRLHHVRSISGVVDFQAEAEREVRDEAVKTTTVAKEHDLINACSASAGAIVLFATDEWFAVAENLLADSNPVFDVDAYCEQGKVMDGWETRRRREPGHDWCIIKLAHRTNLSSLVLDTAYFTGNNAPAFSMEVADLSCEQDELLVTSLPGAVGRLLHGGGVQGTGATPAEVAQAQDAFESVPWTELFPKTPLLPGYDDTRFHHFDVPRSVIATHIRLNYYPDGGVARMRLFGTPEPDPVPARRPIYTPIVTGRTCTVVSHTCGETLPSQEALAMNLVELSSANNGGVGITCSNKHYGDPANLIQASYGRDMGDGWETARHPNRPSILIKDPITNLVDSPLSDWCILKLGSPAEIERIILDTKHFRGNYPESVSVEGCYCPHVEDHNTLSLQSQEWFTLVPRGRMAPDSEHMFDRHQIRNADRPVSHVRVSICPDGGLSRVRVYGAALQ